MPTYDYRCRSCGYEFEEFQSIAADSLTECPRCEGKIFRVISGGGGLIFKGSGFYETDYKRKSADDSRKKEGTETTPKPATSSKPETKTAVEDGHGQS